MLSLEDQTLLGMAMNVSETRRSSGVSQALRAIRDDFSSDRGCCLELDATLPTGYRILVASNRATRQRAYTLAHWVYQRSGYVPPDGPDLCVSPFDALRQTLTLLAEDSNGNDWGTISLVFDSEHGLPCNEIYQQEVDAMRARGCRLAEVTRLAIDDSCPVAKSLLLHLFNQCYIFARLVRGYSDLVVEVNPRHAAYYRRIMRFQQAGPQRPCSRVQGAPAVLLHLNLSEIEATVKSTGCTLGRDLNGRRLHRYPYSKLQEEAVIDFLINNHKPMDAQEARYFGLDPTPFIQQSETVGS